MVDFETGNKRLLKLADFLEKLHADKKRRKQFDYTNWVNRALWKGKADLSCGTTACALGWATTIPEFRKAGLRLGKNGNPTLVGTRVPVSYAAEEIFGTTGAEFQTIFMGAEGLMDDGGRKRTAKDVALIIRAVVALRTRIHAQ